MHGVKKQCQKWHWVILFDYSMPCLAIFFDVMTGVKKLIDFITVITCPTLQTSLRLKAADDGMFAKVV